jgi:tetratricopeptide (TPR) repeat protein
MQDCEKAMSDYARVVELNLHDNEGYLMMGYRGEAWVWATCPIAAFRDGAKALEAAQKAFNMAPGNATNHDAVAAAYAELGHFKEAVFEANMAIQLRTTSSGSTFSRAYARLALYEKAMPCRELFPGISDTP